MLTTVCFLFHGPCFALQLILRPDGSGDSTSLSASTGSNYSCVDDTLSDDDASYVSGTSNELRTDLFTMQNHVTGTAYIDTLYIYARISENTIGTNKSNIRTVIKTNNNLYYGNAKQALNNVYSNIDTFYVRNPVTGSRWTWNEVDNLQAGIAIANSNQRIGRCTQVWVRAIYDSTQPPSLNSPAASQTISSHIPVSYVLPETALSGSVTLTFQESGTTLDPNSPHVVTFGPLFETMGQHVDTLNATDLSASTSVVSVSTGTNDRLVDGARYNLILKYQDMDAHPLATATQTALVCDPVTIQPVLTAPLANTAYRSTLPITFSLPEKAKPGTVRITFTENGTNLDSHAPHTIVFSTAFEASGNHTTVLNGSNLSDNQFVASVNSGSGNSLISGAVYNVKIAYQDSLGNPIAESALAGIVYDVTPPGYVSSYPHEVTDGVQAGIAVSTTENARLYAIILPADSAVPSSLNVRNGHSASDLPLAPCFAETLAVTAQNPDTLWFCNLSSEASYSIYLVAKDALDNIDNIPRRINITTADTTAPYSLIASPRGNDTIRTAALVLAFTETAESCAVSWVRTSGVPDQRSPHRYTITGADLDTATDTIVTITTGDFLVRNTVYQCSVTVCDSCGNCRDTAVSNLLYQPHITRIALNVDTLRLHADETQRLNVRAFDADSTMADSVISGLTWSILDTNRICTVSGSGMVAGIGIGVNLVRVVYNNSLADTCVVLISPWQQVITGTRVDTLHFGTQATIILPPILSGAGSSIIASPSPDSGENARIVYTGSSVSFDTAGIHSPGVPVTLRLHPDSARIINAGFSPSDVRAFYRKYTGDTALYVIHDFSLDSGWLTFTADTLGTFFTGIDTSAPRIDSITRYTNAVESIGFTIAYTITDNIANPSTTLRYKIGGERTPTTVTTNFTKTGQATIPSSALTATGLSYVLTVDDGSLDTSSLVDVSVRIAQLTKPQIFAADYYQMVSIPLGHPTCLLSSMLLDDTGPFDKTLWRMYTIRGTGFLEIEPADTFVMKPATAVWLRHKSPVPIDVDSGFSLPMTSSYSDTLAPGWNAIATPFNFSVAWQEIKDSTGADTSLLGGIYAYDHITNSWSNPLQTRILEPWKGYVIYNSAARPCIIRIPPYRYDAQLLKIAAQSAHAAGTITIAVTGDKTPNSCMLIAGYNNPSSREQYDRNDYLQPPSFNAGLKAAFIKHAWGRFNGRYMIDMRDSLHAGKQWEFTVDNPICDNDVSLRFHGLPSTAMDYSCYLIDKNRNTAVLLEDSVFSYLHDNDQPRNFCLLIGTTDYLQNQTAHLHGIPQSFALRQNYPNPFHTATTIRYSLPIIPRATESWIRVHLAVYDTRGRVVTTLVAGKKDPGYYSVQWDGQDLAGKKVTAGTYICRLYAGKVFCKSIRILKIH